MSRYLIRQSFTRTKFFEARAIVQALRKAAEDGESGVYAPDLPGLQPRRPAIMQWLSEMGVPIVARKQGRSSVWFIISMFDGRMQHELSMQLAIRILQHHYAEACRKYISLSGLPDARDAARMLQRHATEAGSMLGLSLDEIVTDLRPTPMGSQTRPAFGDLVMSDDD